MDQSAPTSERGLRDHVGVLRRRLPLILGLTALTVLGAIVFSLRQPTVYQASVEALFRQEQATVEDPTPDQMVLSKRLDPNRVMQNEVRLAGSEIVRDRAAQKTGGSVSASAQNVRDSDVITITASGSSAERAASNANAWADSYVEISREKSQQVSDASVGAIAAQITSIDNRLAAIDKSQADGSTAPDTRSQLTGEREALVTQRAGWTHQQALIEADKALAAQNQVLILTHATPPGSPSQPATARNALLALLVGLGFALVLAYAVDSLAASPAHDEVRDPVPG